MGSFRLDCKHGSMCMKNVKLNELTRVCGLVVTVIIFFMTGSIAKAVDAHDKLKVLDLKIGMSVDAAKGFTCTKEKWTQSHVRIGPICVKFLDERCKGKPSAIGSLSYNEKAPKGCHYDPSSMATRLDNTIMQDPHSGATDQPHNGRKPLNNVAFHGTKSDSSKIYRIEYMLDEDDVKSKDSKIYKALVAKYGEPTYPEHSGKVTWKADGTELIAYCQTNANCTISVSDSNFESLENDEQKAIDAKKKASSAPAPQL